LDEQDFGLQNKYKLMLENNELTLQKIIDDDQIYCHVKNRELVKFFDK